ncbi:MAG TPA: hypothetical protein VLD63_01420 [Anaerolineales bacterium]|nr:hypothetical protein [Anaerolineales bacterium]
MARRSTIRLALAFIVLNAAILACAYAANPTIDVGAVVSQTLAAAGTQAAAMVQPGQPTAAPAVVTPEVVTPEASPTAPIVHVITPGSPGLAARFITDRSSSALAGENRTIADDFNNGFLERPLTLPGMEYQPYLDLTRGEISAGGGWIYIVLFLEGAPSAGQPATYGAELDLDLDGRGDWWIAGSAPQSTTWTTDGVRALRDTNHDVGGPTPMKSDGPPPTGDGYETLVFDSGRGDDPDYAYIRLSPTNPKNIELAIRLTLIGGDTEFLWGIWADASPHPEWFDYNDHFTLEQAGSPLIENSNYPLKDLSAVDSSCRWGYDFNPIGNEPGICRIPPTPTPTLTPSKTPTRTPTLIIIT